MQYASPSGLPVDGGQVLGRVRETLRGGRFWSFVLVLLLTLTVASSTSTFHWVDGIEVVVPIALLGAALLGALALTPMAEWIALAIGVLGAVPIALLGAWPQIHVKHPNAVLGPQVLDVWSAGMKDGSLITDTSFYLVLICLLMWVTGAWLSWCVLRWRKPMLGLIPAAAAFSTNALNYVAGAMPDQNGFAFEMIVLIILLLLWNNYSGSLLAAARSHVRLSGDAKWDFWESGLVAMLAVVVLSIFMPQLSKQDRTVDVESGLFASWAQLQAEINHPGFIGNGLGGSGYTTGFADDVKLAGSIARNNDIVFVYQPTGNYGGPRYFRGLDVTMQSGGEWRYAGGGGEQFFIRNGQPITYGEKYDGLGVAAFTIRMIHPPSGFTQVLFYPGLLAKVDRSALARQAPVFAPTGGMMSIDRLDLPARVTGSYTVYSEYSGATAAQLQAAGTDYPDWVRQFAVTPDYGYRSSQVLSQVDRLAQSIVNEANATNPYDEATAIETYLREHYKYSLTVPTDNRYDSLENFLFHSKVGYCEYFATAMGDMLRSLGIPTRLVNGFGPGSFDSQIHSYVVKASDAHTWVEAYFPGYGWIPFEPTADSNYPVVQRGQDPNSVCYREQGCDQPDTTNIGGATGGTNGPSAVPSPKNTTSGGSSGGGLSLASILGPSVFTKTAAAVLGVVLLLLLLAVRYLRPRTVMSAWNRMLVLASLAGAERRPGETPFELGRRLQSVFPEAAEPVAALTSGFAIAAYAPQEEAAGARATVMEAWTALRPHLLRRVVARLRPRTT